MVDWVITATTIYCDAVDDEVTLLVHKDGTVKCIGHSKYAKPDMRTGEVEYMGVKILSQFVLLGQYDFVNILEAPSNEAIAKLAIRLSAKGTTQALTPDGDYP
ncbi:GYD domain-containing protein [Chloroflexota bacterium]